MTYNLGNVKPWVRAAADELGGKFNISSIGGVRASAKDPNGHPAGRALDLMVSDVKRGTALAEYAKANARRLGVEYVIWRQRIWSVARNGEGWRAMEDRGSPTQNHMDHVHVNFTATAPPGGGAVVDTPTPTWKPNMKRINQGTGNGGGGGKGNPWADAELQKGGTPGDAAKRAVGESVRGLAIVGACLLGGVALITLGAAATARTAGRAVERDGSREQAMQMLSFLPQGRAATAATTASGAATSATTSTTKGKR